jgi:HAD superfamily hydrolase (TIGR01509 family)
VHAVIFDFDGVLADTERLHLLALQQAFAARGWTMTDADYFAHYLGYDDRGIVAAFSAAGGIQITPRDAVAVLADKKRVYGELLAAGRVLFPGARACIQRLAEVFPLAIASGSLRGEIEHILAANRLRDAFTAVVGADDVREGKPAPDSYLSAAAALGVHPAHALAIEDSPWGLQSARSAGLVTIGVTTSYRADGLVEADHIITSLEEVTVALVRRLLARGGT